MKDVGIPRCFKPPECGRVVSYEVHHFADASKIGYGACAYLRVVDEDANIFCTFLMGKSRLTPKLERIIPELELMAAVVSAELDQTLRKELKMLSEFQSTFWTDSEVTLKSIHNKRKRFRWRICNYSIFLCE